MVEESVARTCTVAVLTLGISSRPLGNSRRLPRGNVTKRLRLPSLQLSLVDHIVGLPLPVPSLSLLSTTRSFFCRFLLLFCCDSGHRHLSCLWQSSSRSIAPLACPDLLFETPHFMTTVHISGSYTEPIVVSDEEDAAFVENELSRYVSCS